MRPGLSLGLALALAAIASPAFAQLPPVDDEEPPPPDPVPPPQPQPPPPRPIPVEPTPVAPAIENEPEEEAAVSRRPEAFSIGIGAGYQIPADLQAPNRASVRFRLPGGLTFEPIFALARSGTTTEVGGVDASTSTFGLALATDARLPMRVHDRVDFILIGGAGIGFSSTNPDGDDNDTSRTAFDIHWGLGLEFWITHHWSLSFNATNPLLEYTVDVSDTGPGDPEQTTTSSDIGLVFAPEVAFMIHLYL